jgi:hypothetical protein
VHTHGRRLRHGVAGRGLRRRLRAPRRPVPRQALLVDLGDGHDTYRSLRLSQGVGVLGVGLLLDLDGQDAYDWPGAADVPVGNDATWIHPATSPANAAYERGGGVDLEDPSR